MRRRACYVMSAVFVALTVVAAAQSAVPSTAPTVTAENEPWFLNGEPVSFGGNLYFPSGAQIYFNANEMIRSGFHFGVPLYTRTTLEPYSVVYVPLANGRMQPYERPRTGELTGTAGSTPVTLPTPGSTVPPGGLAPQAAGPPAATTQMTPVQMPRPMVVTPPASAPVAPDEPRVGTSGRTPARPTRVQIGGRPQGANAMFIEYRGVRWFPSGGPVPIDPSALVRLEDYRGFAVWAPEPDATEIFIPSTAGSALAVRYARSR